MACTTTHATLLQRHHVTQPRAHEVPSCSHVTWQHAVVCWLRIALLRPRCCGPRALVQTHSSSAPTAPHQPPALCRPGKTGARSPPAHNTSTRRTRPRHDLAQHTSPASQTAAAAAPNSAVCPSPRAQDAHVPVTHMARARAPHVKGSMRGSCSVAICLPVHRQPVHITLPLPAQNAHTSAVEGSAPQPTQWPHVR
jgi:hypothetical protein